MLSISGEFAKARYILYVNREKSPQVLRQQLVGFEGGYHPIPGLTPQQEKEIIQAIYWRIDQLQGTGNPPPFILPVSAAVLVGGAALAYFLLKKKRR